MKLPKNKSPSSTAPGLPSTQKKKRKLYLRKESRADKEASWKLSTC